MSEKMREEFHEWCRSIGFTIKMNEWGNEYSKTLGSKLRVAVRAKKLIKRLRSRGMVVFLSKIMVGTGSGT